MNTAIRGGCEAVYLDTDSIFVKQPSATEDDYHELASTIQREVGFPISLKRHYNFVILLPKKRIHIKFHGGIEEWGRQIILELETLEG